MMNFLQHELFFPDTDVLQASSGGRSLQIILQSTSVAALLNSVLTNAEDEEENPPTAAGLVEKQGTGGWCSSQRMDQSQLTPSGLRKLQLLDFRMVERRALRIEAK
jgi:hypothetical protein